MERLGGGRGGTREEKEGRRESMEGGSEGDGNGGEEERAACVPSGVVRACASCGFDAPSLTTR